MKSAFTALVFWLAVVSPAAADGRVPQADSLKAQVEALALDHGFAVRGTELLQPADAIIVSGHIDHVLSRLLARYNYISYRDASGRIVSIDIVGERAEGTSEPQAGGYRVPTDHQGAEHYVTAQIIGPSGKSRPVRMLVDTGATTVVLPVSMVEELGFQKGLLQEVTVQTANGTALGRVATLSRIRIADAEAEEVAVTFVPDSQLGGKTLLGMSFLSRFVVTIDDATNEIRLHSRDMK